ncbi:hypothetical protein [Roseobacter weihaiensis]|uniref:hypothetical protein n=1 Tax=Roseobacter weihaiensis TaxID=2763262 RepID=UPI001D0BD898|nr:hypothetical protein [Roseobacter sp. H9]
MGEETAIEFLLNFGGAELHVSNDPKGRGMVEQVIGYEKTKQLIDVSPDLKHRRPLATKWLAKCLYVQGLSNCGNRATASDHQSDRMPLHQWSKYPEGGAARCEARMKADEISGRFSHLEREHAKLVAMLPWSITLRQGLTA